jgi:hypothetical protein
MQKCCDHERVGPGSEGAPNKKGAGTVRTLFSSYISIISIQAAHSDNVSNFIFSANSLGYRENGQYRGLTEFRRMKSRSWPASRGCDQTQASRLGTGRGHSKAVPRPDACALLMAFDCRAAVSAAGASSPAARRGRDALGTAGKMPALRWLLSGHDTR